MEGWLERRLWCSVGAVHFRMKLGIKYFKFHNYDICEAVSTLMENQSVSIDTLYS